MNHNYTEKELKEILGQKMEVSQEVNERLEDVYSKIRSGKVKRHSRKVWKPVGGVAAAVVAAGILCTANPAIAAKLPYIGHIFEEVGDQASFAGDYGAVGKQLASEAGEEAAATEGAVADTKERSEDRYTASSDGLTITLSEVYCNEMAMYLSMEMKAEEPFPATEMDMNGVPVVHLDGLGTFSYNPDNPSNMATELDGKFVDDSTFLGILRIDLGDTRYDYGEYEQIAKEMEEEAAAKGEEVDYFDEQVNERLNSAIHMAEIPQDGFQVHFDFTRFIGENENQLGQYEIAGEEVPTEEEIIAMTDEEWQAERHRLDALVPDYNTYPNRYNEYWYEGPFSFDLEVAIDHEGTKTVPVDEPAEGYYVESVTATPFEVVVNEQNTEEDGMLIVLDANGRKMEGGRKGGYCNVFQTAEYDLSRIDLYNISWDRFENSKIKGAYFETHETDENGSTLKELLDEYSTYHREVVLAP